MSLIQWKVADLYAKRGAASHANRIRTNSSDQAARGELLKAEGLCMPSCCGAVNQLLKSVVREIRMLRYVGAGGDCLRRPGRCRVTGIPTATG